MQDENYTSETFHRNHVGFTPNTTLVSRSFSRSFGGSTASKRSLGRMTWQLPQLPPPEQTAWYEIKELQIPVISTPFSWHTSRIVLPFSASTSIVSSSATEWMENSTIMIKCSGLRTSKPSREYRSGNSSEECRCSSSNKRHHNKHFNESNALYPN